MVLFDGKIELFCYNYCGISEVVCKCVNNSKTKAWQENFITFWNIMLIFYIQCLNDKMHLDNKMYYRWQDAQW